MHILRLAARAPRLRAPVTSTLGRKASSNDGVQPAPAGRRGWPSSSRAPPQSDAQRRARPCGCTVDTHTLAGAAPRRYPATMDDYRQRITIEPGKRGGKPCLRGLRITVYDVLDYLAGGMSEDEILVDFPDLEREDIRAALAFAADRERRLAGDVAA